MLFTYLFYVLFALIFGRLIYFAIRLAWGFMRVLLTLVFLPAIIIAILLAGLTWLALPILVIVGIISLFTVK